MDPVAKANAFFEQLEKEAEAERTRIVLPGLDEITAMTVNLFDNGEDPPAGQKYKWSAQRYVIRLQIFTATEPVIPHDTTAEHVVAVQMSNPDNFMMYVEQRLEKLMPEDSFELMKMLAHDCATKHSPMMGILTVKKNGTHYQWDHIVRLHLANGEDLELNCYFNGKPLKIDNFTVNNKPKANQAFAFARHDPNNILLATRKPRTKKP